MRLLKNRRRPTLCAVSVSARKVYLVSSAPTSSVNNPLATFLFRPWKDENGVAFNFERRKLQADCEHASWRRTYLSQPPTIKVQLSRIPGFLKTAAEGRTLLDMVGMPSPLYGKSLYPEVENDTIENPSGVTIGDLVEHIEKQGVCNGSDVFYLAIVGKKHPVK